MLVDIHFQDHMFDDEYREEDEGCDLGTDLLDQIDRVENVSCSATRP